MSEAHPDLPADQSSPQLQQELTATEGRIAYARQHDDMVFRRRTRVRTRPSGVPAGRLGPAGREHLRAGEEARTPAGIDR